MNWQKSYLIAWLLFGCLALTMVFGMKTQETAPNKATATVNQAEGLLIFAYCKPNSQTDYLGTINIPGIFSDKAEERLKKLIKLAKKEFPKAEALIVADDFGKADAITFKNEK